MTEGGPKRPGDLLLHRIWMTGTTTNNKTRPGAEWGQDQRGWLPERPTQDQVANTATRQRHAGGSGGGRERALWTGTKSKPGTWHAKYLRCHCFFLHNEISE